MAVYAIKSFLKIREAMSDYEYTAAEAHGVIATTALGAMQGLIGAMVFAFGLSMFNKVVVGKEGVQRR